MGQREPCPNCRAELLLQHRPRVEAVGDRPREAGPLRSGLEAPKSHGDKVAYYVADTSRRGVRRSVVAPPIFHLLWKLGLKGGDHAVSANKPGTAQSDECYKEDGNDKT
jgi:hypothetical protein